MTSWIGSQSECRETQPIAELTEENTEEVAGRCKQTMAPSKEQCAAMLNFVLAVAERNRKMRSKKRKRMWARSRRRRRESVSVYHRLFKELEDPNEMKKWLRLDKHQFNHLLQLVTPLIEKSDIKIRKAVSPGERLALTLRYLATGESQTSLGYHFRISHNLVSSIIPEVCKAIYQVLQPTYLRIPRTKAEWLDTAEKYYSLWNFPNCIGALDGRCVRLAKPAHSGSEFYGHFDMIVMALVDADSKFMYLDIGVDARTSDGGVWERCKLREALDRNALNIPSPTTLPNSEKEAPFLIVGDDSFPLKTYLMKPFPPKDFNDEKSVYNYHVSRARHTSENAFGILAEKFQIFKQPICATPSNVKEIIFATAVLHNYLMTNSKKTYFPSELLDREDLMSGQMRFGKGRNALKGGMERLPVVGRGHSVYATFVRETLMSYFNNEGKVSQQN